MKKNIVESCNASCPIRNVLDRLGDKWSMLIVSILSNQFSVNKNQTMRFSELHKAIGSISQKMLTVTLRSLEADGLVSRKAYAEIPPRVEYKLTKLGISLVPHLAELTKWADSNQNKILKSRNRYKAANS